MVTEISAFSFQNDDYLQIPFFENGKPIEFSSNIKTPYCCITLKKASSMRFRWNETNINRNNFFKKQVTGTPLEIELIHSKNIFIPHSQYDLKNKTGDGIITNNKDFVPIVTVADCVPIFLFDKKKEVFAVLHSGWKGTGIVSEAIKKMQTEFSCEVSDILAVIGPHIHSCCYEVEKERADFFINNFGKNCVSSLITSINENQKTEYHLSLAQANINLLEKSNIQNIVHCTDCTSCDERLGSFRRETKNIDCSMSLEEKSHHFTVMAAFIQWK